MDAQPTVLHTTTFPAHFGDAGLPGLLAGLEPSGVWLRGGHGLIGLGAAARTTSRGPDRFAALAHWFDQLTFLDDGVRASTAEPDGPVSTRDGVSAQDRSAGPAPGHLPGQGPAAFTSIAYSPDSPAASRLIVPRLILGSAQDRGWVTLITPAPSSAEEMLKAYGLELSCGGIRLTGARRPPRPSRMVLREGSHPESHYKQAVSAGVGAIAERRLEKLVVARDVVVAADGPTSPGPLLAQLAADYTDCWTYFAGDVLGATPEMLVKVRREQVSARVLAGTVDRAVPADQAHVQLLDDPKQRNEHQLAVASLVEQLAPITEHLHAQEPPSVLELPNVYHLATDVTGQLSCDSVRAEVGAGSVRSLPPALLVAERAHPTAAICGTPTATAAELISSLEEIDRGPFSGPVGWLDTRGNADFGIALRGGVLESGESEEPAPDASGTGSPRAEPPIRIRLYAGCGIVAGSDPDAELAETWAKMRPMLTALGL